MDLHIFYQDDGGGGGGGGGGNISIHLGSNALFLHIDISQWKANKQ